MKIKVLYDFECPGTVDATELRRLIAEGKILAFHRSSGWVRIGSGTIRGAGGDYGGPERRNYRQKSPHAPEKGLQYCVVPESKQ